MADDPRQKMPVLNILKNIKYPGYSRDIVSFGMVHSIRIEGDILHVRLTMQNADDQVVEQVRREATDLLLQRSGFKQVQVEIDNPKVTTPESQDTQAEAPKSIAGLDRIIAISSGKGGVGKSTVAVNLACTAAQAGLKVGILDADIYGPSLPILLGIPFEELHPSADGFDPPEKFGVKAMSIGFLVGDGQPLIWRGPLVNKALEQMLTETRWGHLDCLFLDLPPGTGDVQLTLAQKYQLSGALVVTTPQDIALSDVRRGANMFKTVNVPVLGIVENMSYYRCTNCDHLSYPFGQGGGKREAASLDIPLLGCLPLDPRTREQSDAGVPIVISDPKSETAIGYLSLWENLLKRLNEVHAI